MMHLRSRPEFGVPREGLLLSRCVPPSTFDSEVVQVMSREMWKEREALRM